MLGTFLMLGTSHRLSHKAGEPGAVLGSDFGIT